MLKTLKEKSVLVLGLGREGRDTLKFLREKFPNKKIGVADKVKKEIEDTDNLDLRFGSDYLEAVEDYDVIIKSPGIPYKLVKDYEGKKAITGQTDIFLKLAKGEVVGVTGTKGKSTTCRNVYEILKKKQNRPVHLIGNIGQPVFDYLDKEGIFIYEMSSFQLQTVTTSPSIAVLLNVFVDHLDQHETFAEYLESKKNIARFQSDKDKLIYNRENKHVLKTIKESKAKKIPFNPKRKIKNSAVYLEPILKICELFDVSEKECVEVLKSVPKLPHRLKKVGGSQGIDFYNDSAATIPEAAAEAIKNIDHVETLITGGVDKGGDYQVLAKEILKSKIDNLLLFPDTGQKIEAELESISDNLPRIIYCKSMEEAVKNAYRLTVEGAVLLSPASSSFNMFKSYKDRGEKFAKYVQKYGQT